MVFNCLQKTKRLKVSPSLGDVVLHSAGRAVLHSLGEAATPSLGEVSHSAGQEVSQSAAEEVLHSAGQEASHSVGHEVSHAPSNLSLPSSNNETALIDTNMSNAEAASTSSLDLKTALERHFSSDLTQKPNKPEYNSMYDIKAKYQNRTPYWFSKLQSDCFAKDDGDVKALLYRHEIGDNITATIDTHIAGEVKSGLLVTGPQGIGKSFSLVNTVVKMESTGDYLVSFVPDCEDWWVDSN
jgi:hypothetical protein